MSEHRENGCSCEEPPDMPELDLDRVEAAHAAFLRGPEYDGEQAASFLLDAVPQMLARLRAAEAELKGFGEMESEREYCTGNNEPGVPGGPEEPSGLVIPHQTLAGAVTAAEENDRIAYGRSVLYGPWGSTDGYPF